MQSRAASPITGVLWAAVALTSAGAGQGPSRTIIPIPFSLAKGNGAPIITARIDGSEPVRLVLDSGCTLSLLRKETVSRIGGLETETAVGYDGQPIKVDGATAQMVKVSELWLGERAIGGVPFLVLDRSEPFANLGEPVDGIIGANMLATMAARIDFDSRFITLWYPGDLPAEEVRRSGFDPNSGVELTADGEDLQYKVAVRLSASASGKLLLDTGSAWTIVTKELAGQASLVAIGSPIPYRQEFGITRANRALAKGVSLSHALLPDLVVGFQAGDIALTPRLGLDALNGYNLLIDAPGKKLYLARRKKVVGIGLRLKSLPNGRLVVDQVAPGSPAVTSGIHVGDVVSGVRDFAVTGMPQDFVNALLVAPEGAVLDVRIRPASGREERTVALKVSAYPLSASQAK